jgi:hypothetical protein
MGKEAIKGDNYDTYVTLLDIALALKKIADIIGCEERGILKILEGLDKRMDRLERLLGDINSLVRRDYGYRWPP